jgi:hypothetical protein
MDITSTLMICSAAHALLFCQTVRDLCSITIFVDIAPSLYENYVVVILYALIREGSF